MTLARMVWNRIESNDHRLMRHVHKWRPPRWFRFFMVMFTRMGDGWLWYGIGLVLLLFGGSSRFMAFGSAALASFSGILLFRFLKRVSHRKRPCELEPHCWSLVLPPDQFSFPSGHSITSFGIAIALGWFYPELLCCLLLIAASIAVSRIILGMHFLSDVVAGSFLGCMLGYGCVHLLARL